ncbi:MAG: type II toxin-antitoxin system VapC family toxin [Woeseiaceae bacterium]
MRVLLDTHDFIWSVMASRQLKADARAYLASAQAVYVSAASIWEIAIKSCITRIPLIACSSPRRSVSRCGS